MGARSKLIDHLVPAVIDVPKVYRMISSRSVAVWTLQTRASRVKVKGREHRGSGAVCAKVGEEKLVCRRFPPISYYLSSSR